ncbi:MAG: hypothetical protein OXU77_03480 [Gammaproteobacteria bacterium]|nr:hypothetical protein [Gammaproteobacteria bacterium]
MFLEETIRENLDLGRPDRAQLIFDRRILRRTRTRSRLRVVTNGVVPSLLVDYKHSHVKQYLKGGRALRTETVVNDTYEIGVNRKLINLDDLKRIGFAANRRLLGVQRISHDPPLGQETSDGLHRPAVVGDRRASALRFGDPRVQALLATLLAFRLLPAGFANRDFREHAGPLFEARAAAYGPGRATYDLGRLRRRGLVERIPRTHRYRVTALGHRVALCYCRAHRRVLAPALAAVADDRAPPDLGRLVRRFDHHVERLWEGRRTAA